MSRTIDHIRAYIAYLEREHSLSVTLHDHQLCLSGWLAEFNIHTNPYCLCMKTDCAIWEKCVDKQEDVREKCRLEGRYFGMCHAGVCEYVYPIKRAEELVGFVSVSGYRPEKGSELYNKAMHKLNKLCSEFGGELDSRAEMYDRLLSTDIPEVERLDVLIEPLCDMFVLCLHEMDGVSKLSPVAMARERLYYNIANEIRRDHNSDINLDRLAAMFNYSKSYISHVFKSYSGMTIRSYVNRLRIAEAKAMLTATELPIQEIALTIGFTDSNYFTNVFRAECGMSPRSWRKLYFSK